MSKPSAPSPPAPIDPVAIAETDIKYNRPNIVTNLGEAQLWLENLGAGGYTGGGMDLMPSDIRGEEGNLPGGGSIGDFSISPPPAGAALSAGTDNADTVVGGGPKIPTASEVANRLEITQSGLGPAGQHNVYKDPVTGMATGPTGTMNPEQLIQQIIESGQTASQEYNQRQPSGSTGAGPLVGGNPPGYGSTTPLVQYIKYSPEQLAKMRATEKAQTALATGANELIGSLNFDAMDMSDLPPGVSDLDLSGLPALAESLNLDTAPALKENIDMSGLADWQNALDFSGLNGLWEDYDMGALPGTPEASEKVRSDVAQALFDRQRGLARPEEERREDALRQRLANQGLYQAGEAHQKELGIHEDAVNRAIEQSGYQSVLMGGAEQERLVRLAEAQRGARFGEQGARAALAAATRGQRAGEITTAGQFSLDSRSRQAAERAALAEFENAVRGQSIMERQMDAAQRAGARQQYVGEGVTRANLRNTTRQQALGEKMAVENSGWNRLAAALGGSQIQGPMGVAPVPQVDIMTPYMAEQARQQNAYNQSMQDRRAGKSGMTSLAGAGIGAIGPIMSAPSSSSLKTDKAPAEGMLAGVQALAVERWRYIPGVEGTFRYTGQGNPPGYAPPGPHIGPYAEEFQEIFGVGDGETINPMDAVGVCLGAIKELMARVEELEAKQDG